VNSQPIICPALSWTRLRIRVSTPPGLRTARLYLAIAFISFGL
jgi:hypothetical protein